MGGGSRETSGIQGGDKVNLLTLAGTTASTFFQTVTAAGALGSGHNFDHLIATNAPGLDLVGMQETKQKKEKEKRKKKKKKGGKKKKKKKGEKKKKKKEKK